MKKINCLIGILMFVFATTALGQTTTPDEELHIYIAFGQSNMQGPGEIRQQDKEGISDRFQLLNIVNGTYGQENRTKSQWYKAVPPLIISGNLNHYSGGCTIGLSPADYFGRTVADNTPDNIKIGLIAVANGDLALASYLKTQGATYFAPGSGGTGRENGRPSNTERDGWNRYTNAGYASLYDAIITNTKLAQAQGGIVKGIIFHQGESGRGLTYTSWGNMLKEIYNDMLADLGLDPNSIPILCGQTWNGGSGNTGGALANDAAIQAFIPNAYVISSRGCAGRNGSCSDNIHFGSEGQVLLGTRYGDKMVELVYGATLPGFKLSTSASPSGSGSVTLDPAPTNGRYEEGAVVTLTAEPAYGYKFDGWGEDATGNENPLTVTMDANKNITAKFIPTIEDGVNIIKNGNFINTQDWNLQAYGGSAATWSVAEGKAKINITAIGTNTYEPQFVQKTVLLEKDEKYRFSFDASADAEKVMEVMFQGSGNPDYATYKSFGNLDLTTEIQSFSFDFDMTFESNPATQLAFNVGTSTVGVTLSNVKLIKLGETGVDKTIAETSNLRVITLPNSAVKVNFIASGNGETDLRIYCINGNLVASAKRQTFIGESCSYTFDQGILPSGFYVVQVRSNGSVEQAKVLIP